MSGKRSVVHGFVGGGLAFLVGGIVPFSPIVGGAVAGYLEGGFRIAAVKVGALAGTVASIPVALIVFDGGERFAMLGYGESVTLSGFDGGFAGFTDADQLLFFGVVALSVFAFVVGFSVLGSLFGNAIRS